MNRIKGVLQKVGNKPTANMAVLLDELGPPVTRPEPDKYYVFVYTPKTRGIRYDQHPFIQVSWVSNWGFSGLNHHWDDFRRYTWAEMGTPLFEIYEDELDDMSSLPIALFKQS